MIWEHLNLFATDMACMKENMYVVKRGMATTYLTAIGYRTKWVASPVQELVVTFPVY